MFIFSYYSFINYFLSYRLLFFLLVDRINIFYIASFIIKLFLSFISYVGLYLFKYNFNTGNDNYIPSPISKYFKYFGCNSATYIKYLLPTFTKFLQIIYLP